MPKYMAYAFFHRFNYEIIIVPADDLAPQGARSSAGTVMTNFGSCNYIWEVHDISYA